MARTRLSKLLLILLVFATTPALSQTVDSRYNGMWYQPDFAGHGFNLALQDREVGQTVFVTFFTYDDDNQANFYTGNIDIAEWRLGEALEIPLFQPAGGGFSELRALDFSDPAQFIPAGTLSLTINDCSTGRVVYSLTERTLGIEITQQFVIEKLIGAPVGDCRNRSIAVGAIEKRSQIGNLGLDDYRYFLYVPSGYDASQPLPLMVVWHGAAGPGRAAESAAAVRDLWQGTAETEHFIVLAQAATGSSGGWIVPNAATILEQLLDEVQRDYRIDPRRVYGWGFSAGAHTMHAVALASSDRFAGYAVNAGALNAVVGRNGLADVPRKIPISSLVGANDSLLSQARGDRDALLSAGWVLNNTLFYREFGGGHAVLTGHPDEHWANLRSVTLPDAKAGQRSVEP